MTEKQQAIAQAVIPSGKKPSTYVGFVPTPYYGRMNGSQVVEADDELEPRYIDGMAELRREALKTPKARSKPD